MVMKEKDDELSLFVKMSRTEKEKTNLLLLPLPLNSDDQNASFRANGGGSPIPKVMSSVPMRKSAAENFLNSENVNDKTDYNWLLTPPGTPLFPSLEMEPQKAKISQMEMPDARPTALKTRLANIQEEPASRGSVVSKNPTLPSRMKSSSSSDSRPSSSGVRFSSGRASTPTRLPTLTTTARSSRQSTPTSRATFPSSKATAPAVRSSTPTRSTSRSSTPTARATVTASKPARISATPTSRATIRSTPPASRGTLISATTTPRQTIRSATPTRQSSVPSGTPSVSAAPGQSSSVSKSRSITMKNSIPSRSSSPTVKSRPWKPSEVPGFSLEAQSNLRTSLPERPASASRGRPGAPRAQSPSVEASNGRRRQQSCSPSRVSTSSGTANGHGRSIATVHRANSSDGDEVNPVVIGTRMVERVVNMRKLAPLKQDYRATHNSSGRQSSSSLDSSGFGRTLSKKSLDMALRHMSVRPGSTKSRTIRVMDSPLARSSNASSEPSVNTSSFIFDGSELGDSQDFESEIGNSSPVSQHSHHDRLRSDARRTVFT